MIAFYEDWNFGALLASQRAHWDAIRAMAAPDERQLWDSPKASLVIQCSRHGEKVGTCAVQQLLLEHRSPHWRGCVLEVDYHDIGFESHPVISAKGRPLSSYRALVDADSIAALASLPASCPRGCKLEIPVRTLRREMIALRYGKAATRIVRL